MAGEITTLRSILSSLGLLVMGYGLGAPLGLGLGLLVGLNPVMYYVGRVVLQLPLGLPAIALLPILLLGPGNLAQRHTLMASSESVAITITAYASIWPAILPIAFGMRQAQSGGRFLPHCFLGLKFSLAMAWFAVIAVEFLVARQGLGFQMWDAYNSANWARLADGLIATTIVGFLLQLALDLAEFLLMRFNRQRLAKSASEPPTSEDTPE